MTINAPDEPQKPNPLDIQAAFVGHVTDAHRAARPQVKTHPIDNVEPGIVADRDDGIFVEAESREGGGYRVHVTIADVAAHIRLNSLLGKNAIQRVFTIYGPGWTNPMFPKLLEERMSLEHEQERLGMTVTIDLDKNFCPIHTEWRPTITHAENISYVQAGTRVQSDPQLALMDKIAAGIRRNYFGSGKIDPILLELLPQGQSVNGHIEAESKFMRNVATYMLLTNSCIADFSDRSELPFMFRNFNEYEGDLRAGYSEEAKRHTALEKTGLKGAYCHFTSPIRRAPDFINAHIAHFVYNALDELEEKILSKYPDISKDDLHQAIWDNGAEIMRLAGGMKNGSALRNKVELEKLLSDLITPLTGEGKQALKSQARKLTEWLATLKPPISREELHMHAEHFNALGQSTETRTTAKKTDKYRRAVEVLTDLTKEEVAAADGTRMSKLLQYAIITREMPRPLYNELLKRIQEGRYDPVMDGFLIMMQAPHEVPRWNMLKRAVSRDIKHDPETVNSIFERAKTWSEFGYISESLFHAGPGKEYAHEEEEPDHIHSAIVSLKTENGDVFSAPFYSVGHNRRAAKSHARFSFLEHYAFGELQSFNKIAEPNILYANLRDGASKKEIVEEMLKPLGADLQIEADAIETGFLTRVRVSGGEFHEPIIVTAQETTQEESIRVALRRMLREPAFKHIVSQSADIRHMLNPQHVLQELVTSKGATLEIPRPIASDGHGFTAHVKIISGEGEKYFEGHGPNMDRAIRTACVAALASLDWSVGVSEQIESWVSDVTKAPRAQRFDPTR